MVADGLAITLSDVTPSTIGVTGFDDNCENERSGYVVTGESTESGIGDIIISAAKTAIENSENKLMYPSLHI